jgi:hypothetical protein
MKTFLIAILMFTGLVTFAPSAEARRYYGGGRYYHSPRYYSSGYRYYPRRTYYPRYYSRNYYRPYYYRSYYRPYYYSSGYCYPGYGYYRRPGVSISFGF